MELSGHLRNHPNPVEFCFLQCLYWLAESDGNVHSEERTLLHGIATKSRFEVDELYFRQAVESDNVQDLLFACSFLKDVLTKDGREAFITSLISVAVADGRISLTENHICRFFADSIGFGLASFNDTYHRIANACFPEVGEPSSRAWWESKQSYKKGKEEQQRESFPGSNMSREEAIVVLGIHGEPTPDAVKKAYRRMAQQHHPDRFSQFGEIAEKRAKEMFERIRRAYEVLA